MENRVCLCSVDVCVCRHPLRCFEWRRSNVFAWRRPLGFLLCSVFGVLILCFPAGRSLRLKTVFAIIFRGAQAEMGARSGRLHGIGLI